MKKTFIIFLLIIFSSSFSLAKDNEKITVTEIEDIFFGKYVKKNDSETWQIFLERRFDDYRKTIRERIEKKKKEKKEGKLLPPKWSDSNGYQDYEERWTQYIREFKKTPRFQNRGIAKCLYWIDGAVAGIGTDEGKKCYAKVIRSVMSSSEKSKKRRPGDIFYALDSIRHLVDSQNRKKFIKTKYLKNLDKVIAFDDGTRPIVCDLDLPYVRKYICRTFKKTTLKKIEQFKKDPSDKKVLGHALIKFIEQNQMVNRIEEKLATDNYALLGDFLNATVADVEKNNINPGLQKRRALIKQYSLIMRSIKKKLDEAKYKSIDKDVSKLLKTYENLKALPATANQTAINVDEAVNIIFDANKLVQSSVLSAINNEEEKLLALASIGFMQTLIDSILGIIPEKYLVYTKEINQDFFIESELAELENIITTMTNKNKETKSMELKKNMDIINISFNPSDTLKKLNSLEIINIADKPLTRDSTVEIINQEIRNNLDKEVLKDVRKIFQEMDRNELADITKEASDIASEVASSSSVKEATSGSGSILDKKFGGQSLKRLIAAGRIQR